MTSLSPPLPVQIAASLAIALGHLAVSSAAVAEPPKVGRPTLDPFGAVTRGDVRVKRIALVFTGDERGESTAPILDCLKARKLKAGLFVTGNFVRQPLLRSLLQRAVAEGHYVGPHSDAHLLYCAWDDRARSLVTESVFKQDLRRNIASLRAVGALAGDEPVFFIPPFEWFNRDNVRWSRNVGVTLINFTPGSGSNRDYAPEGNPRFVPAREIYDDILAYERKDPHGLNGFILLLHLGSGRNDPFHPLLGRLCDVLQTRGYQFVRVDVLLQAATD